jgi:hypothetical protein
MISASVAPFFRCNIATTWAVLLPSRGPDSAFAGFAAFFGLGCVLSSGSLLGRLALAGSALGRLCASFALLVGLRLRGLSLGFGWLAQALDTLPDPDDGRLRVLQLLNRLFASQAIQNRYQALRRPGGGQFRQLLLATERVERVFGGGSGLFRGRKRHDFILFVDRKSRHNRAPWGHALRGHHMDHSEVLEKQGDSSANRCWRTDGDGCAAGVSRCQEMSQN